MTRSLAKLPLWFAVLLAPLACGDSNSDDGVVFPDASAVDAIVGSQPGGVLLFDRVDDDTASAQARFWDGWTGNDDPLDAGVASGLCQLASAAQGTDNDIDYDDRGDSIMVMHEGGELGLNRTQFGNEIAYHAVPAAARVSLRTDRTFTYAGVTGSLPEFATLTMPTGWPTITLSAGGSNMFAWSDDSEYDVVGLVFDGNLDTIVCSFPPGSTPMVEGAVLMPAGQSGTVELRVSKRTTGSGDAGALVFLGTAVSLGSYALQ